MLQDILAAAADSKPVKKISVIDFLSVFSNLVLEEPANHVLIQRLAESAGSCEQCDLSVAFNQISDHQSFVDKVAILINNFLKIFHSYGDFLFFIIHICRSFFGCFLAGKVYPFDSITELYPI